VGVAQGVVAAGADHEVAGIRREPIELPRDIPRHRAVHRPQRRPPAFGQARSELRHHVGPAADVGGVVEDRVTKQDGMAVRHARLGCCGGWLP
jgi:hypothetical protein